MNSNESQVKGVLFDWGGTLVNIDNKEVPHTMKRVLEDCDLDLSLQDVSQAWVKSWKEVNFRDLTKLLVEFWVQWNLRILCSLQISPNNRKLAGFIATPWSDYSRVTLHPDAEKVLPQLKEEGLMIGLVTNGLQSKLSKMLSRVGLEGFFDVVVVVDTLRRMKPDPKVFCYALEKLKIAPFEAIFVGDKIETDYKGAQKCGITAF